MLTPFGLELNDMHKKIQLVILRKTDTRHQLLLLQTNEKRGGFWQNVTGSVEEGEDFPLAAARELFEETGIKCSIDDLIDLQLTFNFIDRLKREVEERCFTIILAKEMDEIKLDPKEHSDYVWTDITKISEQNYGFPSNYKSFVQAIKYV